MIDKEQLQQDYDEHGATIAAKMHGISRQHVYNLVKVSGMVERDKAIVEDIRAGIPYIVIAAKWGITEAGVNYVGNKYGITAADVIAKRNRAIRGAYKLLIEDMTKTAACKELAKEFGLSWSYIRNKIV